MKIVVLLIALLTSAVAVGQLDPFYFGTYVNASQTERYTIYTMDEVVEDCFIVEKDRLKEGRSVQHWTGFGHCNGDDGRTEILLENTDTKIPVEFGVLAGGLKSMTIYPPGTNSEIYLENNE